MSESCAHLQNRGGWREDRDLRRCAWPIGPRNTYSNAAYAIAAAYLLVARPDARTLVLAIALLLLAVGSSLYHGLKTRWANNLDRAGMYAVFGALGAHASVAEHPLAWLAMAVTGTLFAVLMVFVVANVSLDLQMGVLLYFTAVPAFMFGDRAMAAEAMGLFIVGFLCWHADRARLSFIGLWGHALWHLFTAAAIALMYLARVP